MATRLEIVVTFEEPHGLDVDLVADGSSLDPASTVANPTFTLEIGNVDLVASPGLIASGPRLAASPALGESFVLTAVDRDNQPGLYLCLTAGAWVGVEADVSGIPPKATNADVDGEAEDSKFTTVAKVFRAIARKVKNATAIVRGIVLLARNEDVDDTETDTTRVPDVAHAIRLVLRLLNRVNQVPDTPGTSTGIGHVLTATGENDRDYAWRAPTAPTAVTDSIAELEREASVLAQSIASNFALIGTTADLQSVTVSTRSGYQNTLNSQVGSARPLLLVIAAAIAGSFRSTPYDWPAGQVLYFPPLSVVAEPLFVIGEHGLDQATVDARVRALVAPAALGGDSSVWAFSKLPFNIVTLEILAQRFSIEEVKWQAADTALGVRVDALPTAAEVTELILENIDVVGVRPTYWSTQGDEVPDPATRDYSVHLHSGIVPAGTTALRLLIHAVRATDVAFAAGTEDYGFRFDAAATGNIQRNVLRDSEGTVLAELQFRDARGAIETRRFTLRVLDAPPTDAAEVAADLDTERNERRAGDTALGTRVTALEGGALSLSRLADKAAYDALAAKDARTLYYWPRS